MAHFEAVPETFRVIVVSWDWKGSVDVDRLNGALQGIHRESGVLPVLTEFSDGSLRSMAVATRPLSAAHKYWLQQNFGLLARDTEFGQEFRIPVEAPPAPVTKKHPRRK